MYILSIMKTFSVYCCSSDDVFCVPCFDSSLSRESIIARLYSCFSLLNGRNLADYHFKFISYLGARRVVSRIYAIDLDYLQKTDCIRLCQVPKSESFFSSDFLIVKKHIL